MLGVGGPDAVKIEKLAQTLGVTKGGFYWHFDDRSALLEEMLDAWERLVVDEAIKQVETDGGNARTKLQRLFALARSGGELWNIELAIRHWARRDKAVAKRLKRIDSRRLQYLRALFSAFCTDDHDVEARSLVVMSLFVANNFIAVEHGNQTRGDVLETALKRLLA